MNAASSLKVLVVDDEATLRSSCSSVLGNEGYDVATCGRGDEARGLLQRSSFDIVLIDLHMPVVSGMELLRICRETNPGTLVIIMTGNPNVESSVEAIQEGAWDYLPKPFTAAHLQVLLGRATHLLRSGTRSTPASVPAPIGLRPPRRSPAPGPDTPSNGHGPAILGQSPVFLRTIRLAEQVAKTDASVFLTGESGAGKEMIAQFIHHRSRRHRRSMVAINCAALPETLLESEMFGHCKGAFTGAVRDKPGLLEAADGGTFFLDELTEMSLPIQAKLLRVIQDGVVRRVGSENVDAHVDLRFIAATNRDPQEATEHGVLRKDLFYRLGVVPLRVPPLRERVEDIPLLATHFLERYWQRHRDPEEELPKISRAALTALIERPWRGNVRELQNVMEHAVVVLEPGSEIQPEDIPYLDDGSQPAALASSVVGWTRTLGLMEVDYHTAREKLIAEFELHYVQEIMSRSRYNMSKAARIAGVDRTTLYRLLQKHGLHRDAGIRVMS